MLKHTDASNGSLVVAFVYQSNTLDLDFDVLNQHIFAVNLSTLVVEGMVNCWIAMLYSWHTFDSDTQASQGLQPDGVARNAAMSALGQWHMVAWYSNK